MHAVSTQWGWALRHCTTVLTLVLAAVAARCYVATLQEADPALFNIHIPQAAGKLLQAVLCFSGAVWLTALHGAASARQRAARLLCLLLLPAVALWYDHGITLTRHGLYSMMVGALMFAVVNSAAGVCCLLHHLRKTRAGFARRLGWLAAALVLLTAARLAQHSDRWRTGLDGVKMEARSCPTCPLECRWHLNIPWPDLLPNRAMNFWVGSQQCPRQQRRGAPAASADFSEDGFLTMGSSCAEGVPCSFQPMPDSRKWDDAAAKGQHHVDRLFAAHLKELQYRVPVQLPDTEAVLVKQGSGQQELLLRVADRRGTRRDLAAQNTPGQPPKLNVLLLYLDAVSRRHFHRKLPQAALALERLQAQGLSSVHEFLRYHSLGWNTHPNSRAMFLGVQDAAHTNQTAVWSSYRRNGYMTGLVSNVCFSWSTDYNGNADADLDHELFTPFCLPEYHSFAPFKGAYSMTRRCLAGRHVHTYNLEYNQKFMRRYDGKAPWFLVNMFTEGHEGTGEVVGNVDADLARFIDDVPPDAWNRTVLLLLSDHGLHMGVNMLYTNNGMVEHMNPLLVAGLPPWLAAQAGRDRLRRNQQRLVTALDLFTTLHDVLHWGERRGGRRGAAAAEDEEEGPDVARWQRAGGVDASAVRWGASLLREVPAGRTCSDLGLHPSLCTCYERRHQEEEDL